MNLLIRVRLNKINKRGVTAYEAVMIIVRTLMLVFVLLSLVFVLRSFIVRHIDTRFIESYDMMNVMYYSDNALAFKDAETGRVYPGIITSDVKPELNGIFSYNEQKYGPFIAAKTTVPLTLGEVNSFYNKETFEDWNFLYLSGITQGIGGVSKVSSKRKMLVPGSGQLVSDNVKFEVVAKNVQ